MNRKLLYCLLAIGLTACSSDDADSRQEPDGSAEGQRSAVQIITRTSEGDAGNSGVQGGLYMVNYAGIRKVELQAAGNYVDNQLLNYTDGTWIPSETIYWQDTDINADFYAYAPFVGQVADARAMVFRVATDQTSDEAMQKSDFLWGTVQNQSPLDGKFDLMLTHQMSQFTVVVTPGAGFSEGELTPDNISVVFGGSKTLAAIDLQTGLVTATGEVADVRCHNNGDLTYTAVLLPQQIAFANLLTVSWNSNIFTLQNSFVLEAKKQYRLTIKLNKAQGGLNIGIEGWDIIDEDYGGTVG